MGIQSIKPEQLEIVAGIVKVDVFAVLPTDYGIPRLYHKLTASPCHSVVLVVTPLRIVFVAHKLLVIAFLSLGRIPAAQVLDTKFTRHLPPTGRSKR